MKILNSDYDDDGDNDYKWHKQANKRFHLR